VQLCPGVKNVEKAVHDLLVKVASERVKEWQEVEEISILSISVLYYCFYQMHTATAISIHPLIAYSSILQYMVMLRGVSLHYYTTTLYINTYNGVCEINSNII
jgi:hypothetical protein